MRLRLTLLQRFSLLLLVATAGIAVALGVLISSTIEQNALDRARNELRDVVRLRHPFWLDMVDPEREFHRVHSEGEDYNYWSRNIKGIVEGYPIYRIKVWNRGSQIIWSDDRSLVGMVFPENEDLQEVLEHGTIHSEITDLSKLENADASAEVSGKMLEMYLPVLPESSFEVIGVIELYQEVADTYAAVEEAQRDTWFLIGFLMTALYLTLFTFMANASRTISRLQRVEQLERYFSPAVAQAIATTARGRQAGTAVPLTGRVEATVMFVDIRGFTGLVEHSAPESVVAMLSDYMDLVTAAVFRQGGSVDKFLGDGVLAVFGAPIPSERHAEQAWSAAMEVCSAIDALNARRAAQENPPIEVGIALATGEVVTGTIGRQGQMTYTAVGDTVNLASRLVDQARPGELLVTVGTFMLMQDFALPPELSGPHTLKVRGRKETVAVYSLYRGTATRGSAVRAGVAIY